MPGNATAVREVFEAIATRSGPHLAEKHRPRLVGEDRVHVAANTALSNSSSMRSSSSSPQWRRNPEAIQRHTVRHGFSAQTRR